MIWKIVFVYGIYMENLKRQNAFVHYDTNVVTISIYKHIY